MKRFSLVLISLSLVISGFLTSCTKEDDPDGPQISFSNDETSTTLSSGVTSFQINADITSVTGLASVRISRVTSAGKDQLTLIEDFSDKNSYHLTYTVSNIVENVTIEVSATDKNDVENARNFTINITPVVIPTEDKLVFYTGTLAAQLGAQSSSLGSSYATSIGAVYSSAAAKTNASKVDFIYYYKDDATVKAEFISPSYASTNYSTYVTGWGTKNETLLKDVSTSVSASQFDAIVKTNDDPIKAAAVEFPTEQRVTALAVGDVFAFKTAGNKLGLAKVTAVTGTTAGSITIEVKVQK